MNYIIFFIVVLFFSVMNGQNSIEGTWKTIDDTTGKPRSIVTIYKKNEKWFGNIKQVLDESEKNQLCIACEGDDYNKPIEGLEIIKNLKKEGDEYVGGTILDPENGKVYKCKIWIDKNTRNILNVRGYVAFFYRTQLWKREP